MTPAEFVIPEEAGKQATRAMALIGRATNISLSTDSEYYSAGLLLQEIKAAASQIDHMEKAITKPISAGLRKLRDFFRVPQEKLNAAASEIETARSDYRIRAEEQRLEAERLADAGLAEERARCEREAAELEERARKKAEADEAKAVHLAAAGKVERAEAARLESAERARISASRASALRHIKDSFPKATVMHREPPKTQGVYVVTRWSAVVDDMSALIRAVAAGQVPELVLAVNETVLNRMAVALRGQLNYPGVRVVKKETEVVRTTT